MATIQQTISKAKSQIGIKATNIKNVIYNTWYYGTPVSGSWYDWCETFVQWVFSQCNESSLLYTKTANCGVQAKAFFDRGRLVTSGYKAGDVVFFHWSNDMSSYVPSVYTCDHVGIIISDNGNGTYVTVEGNTGSSQNGEVMMRIRSESVISCAGRPNYSGSDPEPDPKDTMDMFYRVRADGKWYREVHNLSDYAGVIGKKITDIAIKPADGKIKYRVHLLGGDWLPFVTGYDISDHENGYAGDLKPIDAIEVYYYTSEDTANEFGYFKAKYRVSPLTGEYYPWQYDNDTDNGQDGYAGEFGVPIDRFQCTLSK